LGKNLPQFPRRFLIATKNAENGPIATVKKVLTYVNKVLTRLVFPMLFLSRVILRQTGGSEDAGRNGQSKVGEQEKASAVQHKAGEIQFEEFCKLTGVVSPRDTDLTVVRVFRVVVERSSPDSGIGSSELAHISRLHRLTALHHLNRLSQLGLLEKREGRYYARDFGDIVRQMEDEMHESIRRAREIARRMETDFSEE